MLRIIYFVDLSVPANLQNHENEKTVGGNLGSEAVFCRAMPNRRG